MRVTLGTPVGPATAPPQPWAQASLASARRCLHIKLRAMIWVERGRIGPLHPFSIGNREIPMSYSFRRASLLLFTTALVAPNMAFAQTVEPTPAETQQEAAAEPAAAEVTQPEEETEVSVPGGEIVVRGYLDRNIAKSSPQVVSVLSSADIARTGEGNIAGALGRVTGLMWRRCYQPDNEGHTARSVFHNRGDNLG